MSGILDWFSSAWDSTKATVDSWYDSAQDIVNQGEDAVLSKINDANAAIQKSEEASLYVKSILDQMPEGTAKDELMQKYLDAQGFFEQYVVPAWNKLSELAGISNADVTTSTTFGILPIVAVAGGAAVVAAALTVVYVANRHYDMQDEIIKDPRFKTAEELTAGLEAGSAGISSIFSGFKTMPIIIALGAVGIGAIYFLRKK